MNTPAHVILSAVALGRHDWRVYWLAITVGALLPDAAMFVFYAWERLVLDTSEAVIWGTRYHDPLWQAFFDAFNSLPLIGLAAVVTWRLGRPVWTALFASMALHALADLPVHHHDAHRHFWPLTDWRFHSPLSYWDPRFHGDIFGLFEMAFVVVGSVILVRRSGRAWTWVAGVTLTVYAVFVAYAILVWGG